MSFVGNAVLRLTIGLACLVSCSHVPHPPSSEATSRGTSSSTPPSAASAASPPSPSRRTPSGPCTPRSCDYASEACCENEAGVETGCVAKNTRPLEPVGQRCYGARAGDVLGIECLSSKQCSADERCCIAESVEGKTLDFCARSCDSREACVPSDGAAAGCGTGMVCAPDPSLRSGGACAVEHPGSACGKQRCEGESAGCCWSAGRGKCVDVRGDHYWPEDPQCPVDGRGPRHLLNCASPADCAGGHCCSDASNVTSCSASCGSGVAACESLDDCSIIGGQKPHRCASMAGKPPFLKVCQYRD